MVLVWTLEPAVLGGCFGTSLGARGRTLWCLLISHVKACAQPPGLIVASQRLWPLTVIPTCFRDEACWPLRPSAALPCLSLQPNPLLGTSPHMISACFLLFHWSLLSGDGTEPDGPHCLRALGAPSSPRVHWSRGATVPQLRALCFVSLCAHSLLSPVPLHPSYPVTRKCLPGSRFSPWTL